GIMLTLSARDSELAAAARALLHWNSSTGFCAACGGVVISQKSGWQRSCAACSASHFPRTDPVVIMLVTRGNRALIGRSHPWPQGMYSCLAGFIEPGETLESAVAREVLEETGVAVKDVRYLASQPWPFPASLMFGCVATAVTENIIIDPVELEDARWISREDMVQVMAGSHPEIIPARRGAIAHYLISCWLAGEI
ncbi:MAG: NAD+ diphosphatase, partial [Paracoccaceae bacterium]